MEEWHLQEVVIQQHDCLKRFGEGYGQLQNAMRTLSLGHLFQPMMKAGVCWDGRVQQLAVKPGSQAATRILLLIIPADPRLWRE